MDNAEKMDRVCNYLRMIERTRLLKNTTEELEELVGFSIGSGNGLARKGGKSLFIKDAIFRELAHLVKQQTELDLQEVLDVYIGADRIYERIEYIANPDLFCKHLVWYYYADEEATDDIAHIIKKTEAKQLPILILMLLKLLPRPSAKGGNVKDISNDYRNLFNWLSETVNKNIITQKLPLLIQAEEEVCRDSSIMCRIHLISIANQILNAYGSISTRERLNISNKELQENLIYPPVEGIWAEDDSSTVFWQFKELINGYNLYRYQLDSNLKRLNFSKFFIRFFNWENDVIAYIIHPHAMRYLVSGKAIPNNLIAYLDCHIQTDNSKQIESISFSPQSQDGKWFTLSKLKHSTNEKFFQNLLDNERIEKTDNHAADAYEFTIDIAAITSEYIYIYKDDMSYYKVPKSLNNLLNEVGFDSNAGVLSIKNTANRQISTYIAFDDFNLFYDISTSEMMTEYQIEIVDIITA